MSKSTKAIRSSGWKTDMLIGFPDGLLLLLFTTQILYSKSLAVDSFYMLHLVILGIATLLMMIAVFRANRGDDDDGTMSPEEKAKLQHLDISRPTIEHIAEEMARDQQIWEKTLQEEQVELKNFGLGHAVRSALATGVFFLMGGCVAFAPYLASEDFTFAAKVSLSLSLIALLLFAYAKSRITGQRPVRIGMRYLVTGGLVVLASYLIGIAI